MDGHWVAHPLSSTAGGGLHWSREYFEGEVKNEVLARVSGTRISRLSHFKSKKDIAPKGGKRAGWPSGFSGRPRTTSQSLLGLMDPPLSLLGGASRGVAVG